MSTRTDQAQRSSDEAKTALLGEADSYILATRIEALQSSADKGEARQKRHEQEEAAKLEERRSRDRANLRKRLDGISIGTDLGALYDLMHIVNRHDRRVPDMAALKDYVGPELAPAILRAYRAFWRTHTPELPDPSEGAITTYTLLGLTGVSFDLSVRSQIDGLTPDEARLATTYALHELNEFPRWLGEIADRHADDVAKVLADAVDLEWASSSGHPWVTSRLAYETRKLGPLIRDHVMDKLRDSQATNNVHMLTCCVSLLLWNQDPPDSLACLSESKVLDSESTMEQRAQWGRLLGHLAPQIAADVLLREDDRSLANEVAGAIEKDLERRERPLPWSRFEDPASTLPWARLLGQFIPDSEERPADRLVPVDSAFRAEQLRNRFLRRLAQDTSLAGRNLMLDLQSRGHPIHFLLRAQLDQTLEESSGRWQLEDVLRLEGGDEKKPRICSELFDLVLRRIEHLRNFAYHGEFSTKILVRPDTSEQGAQRWIAHHLDNHANGLYTVSRESTVVDEKEVDISISADGICRIPIEIKITKNYSVAELRTAIEEQLVGRYMREECVEHGVFLFVHNKPKQWRIDGNLSELDEVWAHLKEFARSIGMAKGKTIAVEIVDLVTTHHGDNASLGI